MFGSRAAFAKSRNQQRMRANLKMSELFPDSSPTSTAWVHKKLEQIKRRNEGNTARTHRMAQEDLLTARLDEERQISELTTTRRPRLIGEGGRVRAAQRAAEEVFNSSY